MIRIIEQSRKEKIAMYMKIQKIKLIEMLINCNDILQIATEPTVGHYKKAGSLVRSKVLFRNDSSPLRMRKSNRG